MIFGQLGFGKVVRGLIQQLVAKGQRGDRLAKILRNSGLELLAVGGAESASQPKGDRKRPGHGVQKRLQSVGVVFLVRLGLLLLLLLLLLRQFGHGLQKWMRLRWDVARAVDFGG